MFGDDLNFGSALLESKATRKGDDIIQVQTEGAADSQEIMLSGRGEIQVHAANRRRNRPVGGVEGEIEIGCAEPKRISTEWCCTIGFGQADLPNRELARRPALVQQQCAADL